MSDRLQEIRKLVHEKQTPLFPYQDVFYLLSILARYEELDDWAKANIPEMDCRGDEDCDHCHGMQILAALKEKEKCPPHSWGPNGERCTKCGDKDWMT